MPENVLEKIIKKKIEKIEYTKKNISIGSLNELIEKNKMFIDFKEMKLYINLYEKNKHAKKFVSICKFVKK